MTTEFDTEQKYIIFREKNKGNVWHTNNKHMLLLTFNSKIKITMVTRNHFGNCLKKKTSFRKYTTHD